MTEKKLNPLNRNKQKREQVLCWIYAWGASTESLLMRRLSLRDKREFRKFMATLIKADLVIDLLYEVKASYETLIALRPNGVRQVKIYLGANKGSNDQWALERVSGDSYQTVTRENLATAGGEDSLIHNLMVQAIAVERVVFNLSSTDAEQLINKIQADSDFDDEHKYAYPYMTATTYANRENPFYCFACEQIEHDIQTHVVINRIHSGKKPDAVFYPLRGGSINIELELTPKTGKNLDLFFHGIATSAAALNKDIPADKKKTVSNILIITRECDYKHYADALNRYLKYKNLRYWYRTNGPLVKDEKPPKSGFEGHASFLNDDVRVDFVLMSLKTFAALFPKHELRHFAKARTW